MITGYVPLKPFLILVALSLLPSGVLRSQTVELSGQFRERSEFNDKNFTEDVHHDVYHQLRTRLRATALVNDRVRVVAEVQDARTFGDEASTFNTGASHFDLRQGFVEVTGCADGHLAFTIGRQALVYGSERLLGAIDWHPYGQTFDAGVLRLTSGNIRFDAIGAAITRNPIDTGYVRDVFLAGGWLAWAPAERDYTVEAFLLYDNPQSQLVRQNRMTTGIYTAGHAGNLDYELDAALQFGDFVLFDGSPRRDINANMVGARLGYSFPDLAKLRIGVGYDRLSGQDPEDATTYGSFHTLYATNHKYYGHMDYFLNIPANTTSLGLQDLLVQVRAAPIGALTIGADIHLFSTAVDPAEWGSPYADFEQSIGTEIDAYTTWTLAEAVHMTLGYSLFSANENRAILRGGDDATSWAWLMTTVNF
ncbi:MAG: alginate export family protein [Bacteroidetes bacterium]|nr:alginate export family protein [Bacteroidota bacterium]